MLKGREGNRREGKEEEGYGREEKKGREGRDWRDVQGGKDERKKEEEGRDWQDVQGRKRRRGREEKGREGGGERSGRDGRKLGRSSLFFQ